MFSELKEDNFLDENRDESIGEMSLRCSNIICEFQKIVNNIYKETNIAFNFLNLEKNVYGFHNIIHNFILCLHKLEIFIFKNCSILINNHEDISFEKDFFYLLGCAHRKYMGKLMYFFSNESEELILNNLKYAKDFECLKIINNMQNECIKHDMIYQLIFESVKKQLEILILCHKNNFSLSTGIFNNELKLVGSLYDINKLREHFIQELNIFDLEDPDKNLVNLKNLLHDLLLYKIKLISNNEICLMLKIYCVINHENTNLLKHKDCKTLFLDLIKLFENNRYCLERSGNLKLTYFSNIYLNHTNCNFIFLDTNILEQLKYLNSFEISYLKDVLYHEINSDSSNKYFYESISMFGTYISNLVNQELYQLISVNV